TIRHVSGHEVVVLTIPGDTGRHLIQAGRAGVSLGPSPGGDAALTIPSETAAATVVVAAGTPTGTEAWTAPAPRRSQLVLAGAPMTDIRTLLVLYLDSDGKVISAIGGPYSAPAG
ncbi:MAG TPA: hypothetical protein VE173_04080, partial [Longimicrobiales bacterium]|nr:hypothetical protein [Longimicrobiales bacterium]